MMFTGKPGLLGQIRALAHARQHLHRFLFPVLEALGVRSASRVGHEAFERACACEEDTFCASSSAGLPAVDALPRHAREHRHRDP